MVGHASLIQASIRMRRRPLPKQLLCAVKPEVTNRPIRRASISYETSANGLLRLKRRPVGFSRWANSDTAGGYGARRRVYQEVGWDHVPDTLAHADVGMHHRELRRRLLLYPQLTDSAAAQMA